MSRNFELLEQIENTKNRKLPVPISTPPVVSAKSASTVFDQNAFAQEELTKLVQRIFWPSAERKTRSVVFCGVDDSKGSSSLCLNVGRELAPRISDKVCVLNLRDGSSDEGHGISSEPSARFRDDDPMRHARRVEGNLWMVSPGLVCNGNGLPALSTLRPQLDELFRVFSYVLIDARPIGLYADTALLTQLADGVVLSVEANSTRRTAAKMAKETLEGAGARLLGVVLNNRTFPIPDVLYRKL